MSQIPALEVENLTKKIKGKQIIKGVSFTLVPGEVFGFLGPNGAGKTTTIRMIVGLISPTSGTIKIGGKNVRTEFTEAMRHLGCIVENPELYPYLTGWENLVHFQKMDSSIPKTRLNEVIELVGLQNRIHDRVSTYSLGMRQRLGIAQALLGKPKVLILDEPTNGLDPAGIREMREFIRQLAREENLSVLVSSHLLSEIQLMCDRVAIISKGAVLRTDSVDNLLAEQERVIWRAEPLPLAKEILSLETEVTEGPDDTLITLYNEPLLPDWNEKLVNAGVKVKEMRTQLPSLEDLFLEVTGGESID
ncbi:MULTISPECIES: ABC transporter ATP-binding protein [Fictibacillus]|uniref:ABC transporter ATP-binding protein n=1 Tax=Fictibacillus TaxID=1329200 RepID=UPI0018CFDF6C|nr:MULTISPECIES: ABC transporter ATP-binding protein [unclassified Fictibacillus]MBH0154959.1 ABC transporter ATP-binding protein [Fictibacillus sp. 5RED26]MBH0165258.1 ABC transporter ATP-binding protein [Fictibacillus sp. 7GRE50]MBH0172149.1 ABC transporter ATP-binding protein [Fictibacillus sp. 23RED33]